MRAFTVVALAACGSRHPPPIPTATIGNVVVEDRPTVQFVAANRDSDGDSERTRIRFAKTSASGIVVTRTVFVPGIVEQIAWEGQEPVVIIGEAEVGRITAAGYERFQTVPESKWIVPKPTTSSAYEPTERFDRPRWRTLVSGNDVWQARCDWGWDLPHGIAHHCVPEGGRCDAWVYAHLAPGALAISDKEPAFSFDSSATVALGPPPSAAPSTAIRVEIVELPIEERGGEMRPVLKCTEGTETIQYPTDDDRDARDNSGDGVSDLTWLSTKPPIFEVTRRVGCLETMSVVFEGCKLSETYNGAIVGTAGNDVLAMWNRDKLVLRWHDEDLGSLDAVQMLAFAPR